MEHYRVPGGSGGSRGGDVAAAAASGMSGAGIVFRKIRHFHLVITITAQQLPRQPSPGSRRHHQSPPPSSCSRPGPPSRAAHTHISGETSRPPRQPSNAHRRFQRSPASRARPITQDQTPSSRGPCRNAKGSRENCGILARRRASYSESDTRTVKTPNSHFQKNTGDGRPCFGYIQSHWTPLTSLTNFGILLHPQNTLTV